MQVLLPLTIKIIIDKRSTDAPFVAYTPELDVTSCGPTEEKARKNLQEAVAIVLEEVKKKGKLNERLCIYPHPRRPSCLSENRALAANCNPKI